MKNLFKYIVLFTIVMLNSLQSQKTVAYTADNTTNFPNPERGFWRSEYPNYGAITVPDLIAKRENNGYSLVTCRYMLANHKTSPISQTILDGFAADLAKCRQAGVKMIPSFWYNEDQNGQDAAYDIVISHLEQLKPITLANADVIAYFGTGFIGAWGEWHTSSNNLVNNACMSVPNANTIGIHNKILEILPTTRMSVVRTPRQWFGLYGRTPITATEAFSGTNKARTGFRNHYFSGNLTDGTSWMSPVNCQYVENTDTIAKLKTFIRNLCAYSVYEMECDTNLPITDPTYSGATTLGNMEYQRLSTGNILYNTTMINRWKNEGYFDEMSRRMGYRFRLINSSMQNTTNQNSNFNVNFIIKTMVLQVRLTHVM